MLGDREAWTQKLDWEHSAEFNKDFGRLSETRNSKPYARNAKPYFQALGSIFCRASLQRCQVLNLNSETVGLALKLNEDNNRSCMLSREVKARFGGRVWQGRAGQQSSTKAKHISGLEKPQEAKQPWKGPKRPTGTPSQSDQRFKKNRPKPDKTPSPKPYTTSITS